MTLPLLFLPFVWRKRRFRPLILAALFVIAGMTLYPFFFPHYAAPIFGIFLIIVVQGLRRIRLMEWRGRPVGQFVFHAMLLILLCSAASELLSPRLEPSKTLRSETLQKFGAAGGKHLILVKYSSQHLFHNGWIYNSADMDASRVIWARDLDPLRNQELIQHYPERNIWVMEVDKHPALLSRYPGTETKRTGL